MMQQQFSLLDLCRSGCTIAEITRFTGLPAGKVLFLLHEIVKRPCRNTAACRNCPVFGVCAADCHRVGQLEKQHMDFVSCEKFWEGL